MRIKNTKVISIILSIITGLVFLLSGFGKMLDTKQFYDLIVNYGFPSLAVIAPLIILVEISIGLGLLLLIQTRKISILAGLALVSFTSLYLYTYLVHGITDCGCFGKIKILELSPFAVFIRNILLLGMTVFIFIFSSQKKVKYFHIKITACFLVMIISSFISGYTFRGEMFKKSKIHPSFGKSIYETALPQLDTFSTDSTYLVYIFSYECETCWNYMENLKQYYHSPLFDRFIVFAAGEDTNKEFENFFKPEFEIKPVNEEILYSITHVAPTLLYIQQDTVKHVIQGSLPSIYLFEKNYLTNESN
jgi:uncharacterized membrane protein YphA (DoxX/SURF4 family)